MDALARHESVVARSARIDAAECGGSSLVARTVYALVVLTLAFATLSATNAGRARAALSVTINAPAESAEFTDSADIPAIDYTVTGGYASEACNFDHDPPVDCFAMLISAPFKLGDGAHTATVLVYDSDGTAATATTNFTVNDTTAPALSVDAPSEGSTVTDLLQFDLTTDDAGVDIFARIDGGPADQMEVLGTSVSWRPVTLANGGHNAVFTAIDPAGNATTQALNFTLADTTAPGLANITPANGSTVRGDRVHVTFNSTDLNTRSFVSLDGHAGLELSPGTSIDISDVPAGAHSLTITSTDMAGNSTVESSNFTVSDTSTGPLTISSPADGATYTAQPRLLISDPALDAIAYARTRVGNEEWLDGVNQYSIATLKNGYSELDVRAVTAAGELLAAGSNFTVNDTTPPSLDVIFPAAGEIVTQLTGFTPVLDVVNHFADDTDDPGVRVRCRLDGGPFGACDALVGDGQTLAAGAHILKAEAIDWAGNAVVQTVNFSVADVTAPAVKILSPADGATVSTGRPVVTFWSDDPSARFRCRIDVGPETEHCEAGSPWVPGAEDDVTPAPGAHTLSVTATDQAGRSATDSVDVTIVDGAPPVVTIISPAAAATLSDRVVVRWRVNERAARVRCRIDGGAQISDPSRCGVIDLDTHREGTFTPGTLANGSRTLAIDVYDSAGNLGTAGVTVTVADVTPPAVHVTGFNYPSAISHADAPIGVHFSSDDPAAGFECRLDGDTYVSCGDDGSHEWKFPPPADGSHTVYVRATDAAGSAAVASSTFTVADTTPPIVSVRHLGQPLGDSSIVPIGFTAQVVAGGAIAVNCVVDGGAPVDCTGGSLAVNFAGGGARTLQVTASDAAANQTVLSLLLNVDPDTVPAPAGPVPGPAPGPAPAPPAPGAPPSAKAAFSAIKPKLKRGRFLLAVKVIIALPAGVNPPAACKGLASLTTTVGRKTVGKASPALRLSAGICSATAILKLKARPIAGKKARFAVAFSGNAEIGGFTATKIVKIKAARRR